MAVKALRRWPARVLFFVRFLGLTGLLVIVVGGFFIFLLKDSTPALGDLAVRDTDTVAAYSGRFADTARDAFTGQLGKTLRLASYAFAGGVAATLMAVLLELVVLLRFAAGNRSAAGFNVVVQIALAIVLLIGVNIYSFRHYLRLDWTRDHRFTLAEKYQRELNQLKGETSVIVYWKHKTFNERSDTRDPFSKAAERKTIEKVKELVDLLREFGPQFKVEILDGEDVEGYDDKLANVVQGKPELSKAIEAAPENSIFFHAMRDDGKELIQRLSFDQFYVVDKVASKESDDGSGNLVLRYQGLDPFIHRILNLDEKRPRVGIAVIHELLSTEGSEEMLTLAGAKKTLLAHGFDVRDVILKKWSEFGPPEPTVATFEENQYENLVDKLADLDTSAKSFQDDIKTLDEVVQQWRTKTPEELTKLYAKQLAGRKVTEAMRRRQVEYFEDQLAFARAELAKLQEERDKTAQDKERLSVDRDSLMEQKRLTDLKAKFERQLADCDLLIVPRMTLMNVTVGEGIDPRVHRLEQAQVDAIKDFMKAGKPVLACFGPSNQPSDARRMPGPQGPDGLEDALSQLGIQFGKQTVLFNAESKSFAERRTGLLIGGVNIEVPPLDFTSNLASARPLGAVEATDSESRKPNPLRASMRIAAESLGRDLKLSVRHPRPITFDPQRSKDLSYEPEFLLTSKESWNDDNPFPNRERTPRPEITKPDDPARGTPDEKRRGPFSIGVAVEVSLPANWYSEQTAVAQKVRVAAIGQGQIFVGQELSPAKEELLLNTCNWLLGREDELPKEGDKWTYPRVHPAKRELGLLWAWGTPIGLPVLCAYLGVVIVLIRRLR